MESSHLKPIGLNQTKDRDKPVQVKYPNGSSRVNNQDESKQFGQIIKKDLGTC